MFRVSLKAGAWLQFTLPCTHPPPSKDPLSDCEAFHPDMPVPLPCFLFSLAMPLSETWFVHSSMLSVSHSER